MKINEAKELIRGIISKEIRIVPYLDGNPGIGKTSIVRQLGDEFGIGVRILTLAQYDPVEVSGWQLPDGDKMKRLRPDWMPTEGRGILFIDELPQANTMLQNIAAQIIDERRVGPHNLPDGWHIVAAGNPQKARAGTSHMPTHLRDRMLWIEVEPDLEEMARQFEKKGKGEEVVAFLRFYPDMLSTFDPDAKSCPSPRSWERVANLMALMDDMPQKLMEDAFRGCVGKEAGTAFAAFLRVYGRIPTIDEIVKDPENVRMPNRPDELYALATHIERHMTVENAPAVMKYMARCPQQEFTASIIRGATKREFDIAFVDEVAEFIGEAGIIL